MDPKFRPFDSPSQYSCQRLSGTAKNIQIVRTIATSNASPAGVVNCLLDSCVVILNQQSQLLLCVVLVYNKVIPEY